MHLLLGDPQDSWCMLISSVLKARNYPYRFILNPLVHPSRFVWRLDSSQSVSQVIWEGEAPMLNDQISSVLVRRTMGWIDPNGWQPDDFAYMQAEMQASLLAWLWSLNCPVINRYPAAIWCRPEVPLLYWQPLLRSCGLPTRETLITNVKEDARSFGQDHPIEGGNCVVYGLLNSDMRYLVASDKDWNGLDAMQMFSPVCLTHPHGPPQFVCVVGGQVVWEKPSTGMNLFEPALRDFAAAAGLDFLELAFAPVYDDIYVIAVHPDPRFDHFNDAARQQIAELIVQVLAGEMVNSNKDSRYSLQKVFV